ncbi:DUF6083 domain-containing protein [Streptomyces nigrescens]|uniref:DUF6083 domain-containing protein n=1 Tax=Streptomyces nigrescens TaxID=1920 RepID=UPI003965C218
MSLHPHEVTASTVPAHHRWHVSSGIAHPAHDGTLWCRIPHTPASRVTNLTDQHSQALGEGGAQGRGGVVAFGGAQSAHGVGGGGDDGLPWWSR